MEDNKYLAIVIAGILGSGGIGAGVNSYISSDQYKMVKETITEVKDTDRDLYKKIAELAQKQNECYSNSQFLKYRLDQMEKRQ